MPSDVGVMTMGKDAYSQKVRDIENIACMCPGACSTMVTANSMQIMTEVLGLNLSGTATIPAVYADKKRAARLAGKRIISLIEEDLKPSNILNREIFLNAVKTNIAMGGSTNVILHLLALAREAKVKLTMDDFAEFGKQIPCICGVKPSGSYSVVDFHKAGGVPALLKELESYLNLDVKTITGQTIAEIIAEAKNMNQEVIRSLDNPINADWGLKILRGNLAPNSAIVRSSSVPESMKRFSGPAKVFNRDQEGVAEALDIPVFLSSLLQVPFISSIIAKDKKVGIVSAKADSLDDDRFLDSVNIDRERVVIRGMENKENLYKFGIMEEGYLDTERIEQEVLEVS